MSKRIKSTLDLPKEFNLKKYECIESMSDKDLFRQLYWRMSIFDECSWDESLATYYLEHGANTPLDESDPFNEIKVETPDWVAEQFKGGKKFVDKYRSFTKTTNALSTGYGIGYLSRMEVMFLAQGQDSKGLRAGMPFTISKEEQQSLMAESDVNHGLLMARGSDSVSLVTDSSLYISVDLNVPDDILIDDFKKLLPIWREEMEMEPIDAPLNNYWQVVRRKIIEYKVLPYIDLMHWSKVKNVSIPSSVLTVALWPYGERGDFGIYQTIKPFIEKVMSYDSLEKLKREISQ
ncbi:TPA: DUF6387 family protein [Citrobacter freundii]|uniref:DUF6387 family protein n=1 Tax=Enterobacteriaceae TaxID=543 RepID=UPI001E460969|nr:MULTISPECIES: DUF6387 family protein [Enterobacteriaceae]EFN4758423.1 hypothetical protein [Escherichia coli]EHK3487261.1 hypothetical protein [Escherichia coli]MCN3521067.1 DUF6387 family protein [Escherichia coli]WNT12649.1 DUF6387 family protein [Citrobacter freundii]HCC4461587.1 hypothetical protein [Citrobacter freundii]